MRQMTQRPLQFHPGAAFLGLQFTSEAHDAEISKEIAQGATPRNTFYPLIH